MKRSQVKTTPKSAKQAKKPVPLKKVQDLEESSGDEVIEEKVVKKPVNKRAGKAKKVVVEEPQIEDSEVEEDTTAEDSNEGGESVEDEEENEKVELEDDDGDNDDNDDDNDDDDDDNDDDEAEAGDDSEAESEAEAPLEKPIGKEKPTLPSKIKVGPIHPSVPSNKVIHISKLPLKCQQIDIVEAFAKYGSIDQVHIFPDRKAAGLVFKSEKAAAAALAVGEKVKVNDALVSVRMRKEKNKFNKNVANQDRTVYVKYIKAETVEEELKEHFKECGEIESIILKNQHNSKKQSYGFIMFMDKSSVPAAVKLHNSVLNGVNITVSESDRDILYTRPLDERLSVLVRNTQNLESIETEKLEAIFSKCGEIDKMQVLCRSGILAFITFKNEEAVEKAIKLSETTKQGIELKVEVYNPLKKWTSIHVSNISKDCTEEDLKKVFSNAGEIVSVLMKNGFANVRFSDSDGYCKSFLYNETFIKGQNIFIEPDSHRKRLAAARKARKPFKKQGFKRSFENGHSAFKPKKTKTN